MSDDITINLAEALNASACDAGTLLQVQAKEQLDSLLTKFEKQSEDIKQKNNFHDELDLEFNPPRYNNTIFISGQRGAGKTTFLRSVLLEQAGSESNNKIKPIAFIDPTLIEVHEHILVQIIAKIQASVTTALSKTSDEPKRHGFQKCMEEMAEGLKLLGNGDKSKGQDPAFFLNKALKHAIGGQNLERKFNELIDKAAEILNVNLLIIAFDDVDTKTTEAFEILELIRKYLTSPKLVVLISGDPSLYSHIVQGQRAKELNNGNSTIKGMDELSNNLPEMISHLEQQYLAKVLPVEHRIELKNLAGLIEFDIKIYLQLNNKIKDIDNVETSEKSKIEIKKHIITVINKSLKINEKDMRPYVNFLLVQPIRTVLQILKSVDENSESGVTSKALFRALRDSYIGDLRKENISIEKLSDQSIHPHSIGMALFNLCKNHGELETGFYARPDGNSNSYNSSMFVLANVISNYLHSGNNLNQSAGKLIQLMMAGPATSTIFMNNVLSQPVQFSNPLFNKNAENFIDYIGLNKTQDSFSLAAHFSPVVNQLDNVASGVIRIRRGIPANFKQATFDDLIKASTVKNHTEIFKVNKYKALGGIENLPLIIDHSKAAAKIVLLSTSTILLASHSISTTSGTYDYVSMNCLLASISGLLLCKDITEVNTQLNKLSEIPTYGAPSNLEGYTSEHIENKDILATKYSSSNVNEISQYIMLWKKENENGECDIPPLMVGKIWTRIHYAMDKVSLLMNSKSQLLNSTIEKSIWVILNSFLIEEVRYRFNGNKEVINSIISAKNVRTSSKALATNLSNIINLNLPSSLKDHLPLTYLMLTCPLFYPYLSYDSNTPDLKNTLNKIKAFINHKNEYPSYLADIEKYSTLSMIFVSQLQMISPTLSTVNDKHVL